MKGEPEVNLPDNLLCQDLNPKLSRWFASRPDARYILRKFYDLRY